MDKQNPFSLYDFLGYFVPGAIALFGAVTLYSLLKQPSNWNDFLIPFSNVSKTEFILPFTLFAYVLGHILSFLSSITVERYAFWSVGYPSTFLLKLEKNNFWVKDKDKKVCIFRNLCRLMVVILVLPITIGDYVFGSFFWNA